MTTTAGEYSFVQKNAWIAHTLIFSLLLVGGGFILFSGVDPSDFESSTGTAWNAFRAAEPEAARYVERLVGLLGASGIGLALFGIGVTLTGFRRRQRSAWRALWAAPVTYGLVVVIMLIYGSPIGYYYLFYVIVQVSVQILSYPLFRRGQS